MCYVTWMSFTWETVAKYKTELTRFTHNYGQLQCSNGAGLVGILFFFSFQNIGFDLSRAYPYYIRGGLITWMRQQCSVIFSFCLFFFFVLLHADPCYFFSFFLWCLFCSDDFFFMEGKKMSSRWMCTIVEHFVLLLLQQ